MQSVSGRIIVHGERQMELVFTQVVGFGAVRQPCQLQLVGRDAVAQVNEGERICGVAPHLPQAQRLFIKSQARIQVGHVEIVVCECKLHGAPPAVQAGTQK